MFYINRSTLLRFYTWKKLTAYKKVLQFYIRKKENVLNSMKLNGIYMLSEQIRIIYFHQGGQTIFCSITLKTCFSTVGTISLFLNRKSLAVLCMVSFSRSIKTDYRKKYYLSPSHPFFRPFFLFF